MTVAYFCSSKFRQIVLQTYPELADDPALFALLGHLLFGTFTDPTTGKLVLEGDFLKKCEGFKGNSKKFSGAKLLRRFQEIEPSFSWDRADVRRKVAKQVAKFEIPKPIDAALAAEPINLARGGDVVNFQIGKVRTRQDVADARKSEENRLQTSYGGMPKEIIEALKYLNSLPSQPFTALLPNIQKATAAVLKLDPATRDHQLRLLRSIAQDPQPFYKPSKEGKTVRIFGRGQNITNLKSEIRQILTGEQWIEADLVNSQLAICAADWKIKSVQDFLSTGRKVWDYFHDELKIPESEREGSKRVFKTTIYSVVFGMSQENAANQLDSLLKNQGILSDRQKLFELDLMADLFKARDRNKRLIQKTKTAVTCFGQTLKVSGNSTSLSVMAQVAQSKEFAILLPIFDLAKKTSDFKIVLWQHDGFSIRIGKKSRTDSVKNRITEAVKKKIDEFGIQTRLEWKR